MKLIKQGKIIESYDSGVVNGSGYTSAAPNAELYEDVPYERLLRFAQLIGITGPAPRPKLYALKKDPTGEILSEDAQPIS